MANQFYKVSKLLCSKEGERGAVRLLERIHTGSLGLEILPNNYPRYTGQLEEEDYISYFRFIMSSNGKKLINVLEEQDAREYVKL